MFGNTEIFQSKCLRALRHFFERVMSVARERVAMERAAHIFRLDQFWKAVFFSRFEFAAVLAQLRRNKIEIDRAIELGFIADLRNFDCRSFLARFWVRSQWRETILIKRPAAFESTVPHLDIVLLAASEVVESKWIFRGTDHTQFALNAGAKSHACLGRSLRDDRFDERMFDKEFRDHR